VTEPAAVPVPARESVAGGGDPAVIQYTSGSTATPKGVLLSHGNVAAGLHAITSGLKWTDGDAFGVWLPLFHDMGLFSLLCGLPHGSSVCLWRPSDFLRRPVHWLRSFAGSGATVLPAPNFCYDRLVDAAATEPLAGLDLSRWRLACNGSEPVRHATLVAFQETFGRYGLRPGALTPVYGLAEATLIVSAPPATGEWECAFVDRDRLDPGDRVAFVAEDAPNARAVANCGAPAPGIRLRTGEPGVVGEIQIAGDPVTAGYLDLPAERQAFTPDGWLRTGDLGFVHNGHLYVTGRLKDMITVRGQNFYAEDVEDIVRTAPLAGPRPAVAIPWQDGDGELMVVLWETRAGAAAALAEELRDRVVAALGLDAVRVIPVPPATIPRTTSGKVQRQAARACVPELERKTG
jgi:fatty-acyl-CoA synthase